MPSSFDQCWDGRRCALLCLLLAACEGPLLQPAGPGVFPATQGPSDDAGSDECADAEPTVGAMPLERLTRAQYEQSVRDLLGLATVDVTALAEDEKVGPFASNTIARPSELVIEQYLTMAEHNALAAEPTLTARVSCAFAEDPSCPSRFIATFGRRAYRRPLSAEEQAAYEALYASYLPSSRDDALRVVVQTMLVSPHFLYRVELAPAAAGARTAALDGYELATRLAFFFTGSTPDDSLLDVAGRGELADETGLRREALRLLSGKAASRSIESFHLQWLALDTLGSLEKDPSVYPAFDPALAGAMRDETVRFAEHVLRKDDARLTTLLTASYSLLEGPLFALYGVAEPADHDPSMPIELDPAERAGLLTQAGFLAVQGHVNQSAPVKRGKLVLENLLCQSLPTPPPDVNTTPPDPAPGSTTRERFEQHRADPKCQGCHLRIDNIGMGFEHYDGIGAFRSHEGSLPVDASGALIGTDKDGAFDGAVELAARLAASRAVHDCVASQWFRYALGRLESKDDRCTLGALERDFMASGGDIRELLVSIALSPAFRQKAVEP